MEDEQAIYLADCLVKYHINAFKIRTYNIAKAENINELPVTRELINFRRRVTSDYSDIDLLSQAAALKDIIDRGAKKISELVVEAQSAEDPNKQLKEAKRIRSEMNAAEEMLEKLNG